MIVSGDCFISTSKSIKESHGISGLLISLSYQFLRVYQSAWYTGLSKKKIVFFPGLAAPEKQITDNKLITF